MDIRIYSVAAHDGTLRCNVLKFTALNITNLYQWIALSGVNNDNFSGNDQFANANGYYMIKAKLIDNKNLDEKTPI